MDLRIEKLVKMLVNYLEKRDGDIDDSILDNRKLLNLININFTTIDDGLKKLLKALL